MGVGLPDVSQGVYIYSRKSCDSQLLHALYGIVGRCTGTVRGQCGKSAATTARSLLELLAPAVCCRSRALAHEFRQKLREKIHV